MSLLFPREIGLRRTLCENRDEFDNYILKVNGKASCYTSLYSFERRDEIRTWKMDIESVVMDRAWWDFDMIEGGTLEDVKKDVIELLNRINIYDRVALGREIRIVFTGRGFHVHQFFDTPVKGTAIARHIDRYQRLQARGLKTLDGVGFPQKLTRIPDTYNPKRGKWAVNIDPMSFYLNPNYEIPAQPLQELKIYDPYTGHNVIDGFNIRAWIANNPVQETASVGEFNGEIGSAGQIPIPPCLEKAIHQDNPKHDVRIALTLHLADNLRWFAHPSTLTPEQRQQSIDTIVAFMSNLGWRDYNEHTTRFHVESIIDYEHTPTKCVVDAGPCWAHDGVKR
ncbi:MAG: hypothetical protein CMF55_00725 [Legionellales bacterium]|nr:hypothetical protein [Legionellales bacterium]